jgi:hypothetical protein
MVFDHFDPPKSTCNPDEYLTQQKLSSDTSVISIGK